MHSDQRRRPDAQGNQGPLRTRHANTSAEDVVTGAFDSLEDAVVDCAHDLGRDQTASVDPGQLRGGASIVVARPVALEAEQRDDLVADSPLANRVLQIVLGDAEPLEIFFGKIDAPVTEIRTDI